MSRASTPPPSSPASSAMFTETYPYRSSSNTPDSSPPPVEEESPKEVHEEPVLDEETEKRVQQLECLLQKSTAFVAILKQGMESARVPRPVPPPIPNSSTANVSTVTQTIKSKGGCKTSNTPASKKGNKRLRVEDDSDSDTTTDVASTKRLKEDNGQNEKERAGGSTFQQPILVTGATLKDYQLEGVAWMAGLYRSGISGILADEMGLGKTLQTIAFHAFLRERTPAPFMVVCPLSVLSNWAAEFERFAPEIPVCVYHGTPEERASIRKNQWTFVSDDDVRYQQGVYGRPAQGAGETTTSDAQTAEPMDSDRPEAISTPRGRTSRGRGKGRGRKSTRRETKPPANEKQEVQNESKTAGKRISRRLSARQAKTKEQSKLTFDRRARHTKEEEAYTVDSEDEPHSDHERNSVPNDIQDSQEQVGDTPNADEASRNDLPPHQRTRFPVVLTTYEMIIKDRPHLAAIRWGFVVVDEGHRLKNMDCRLMREIKTLNAVGRMVLTGTPLHNNLAELWSLLNFVLPDIFSDLGAFQEWFNLPTLQSTLSSERSSKLVQTLHSILRPFLLRRLKVDVETSLPPKKEYVLYAPLSARQHELYDAIVGGGLRAVLLQQKKKEVKPNDNIVKKMVEAEGMTTRQRSGKGRKRKTYTTMDGDDDVYFEKLESGELEAEQARENARNAEELGREWQRKALLKKVNNMKLQNTVMQLRKVCSHPFLFDWPTDPESRQPVLNKELVSASGKMMVLDRLLDELFNRGHKVLLFSQFTTMLDIIEDWALEFKGWPVCRIDGSTSMTDRRDQVEKFQNSGDAPDAPHLFLLSTRAGGLGLNLVAADTVIFYDQDWNPQMDLQAQDRAHRIGQTKPVLIFRLVSAHTIETKIMQRASEKRQLEAVVIAKGKFKAPTMTNRSKPETMAEMAASLLRQEGEQIEVVPDTAAGKASVISDADLDMLLDRRPEVFVDRGKGWTSSGKMDVAEEAKGTTTKTAFAVYEAPVDEGTDVLAGMLQELDEE